MKSQFYVNMFLQSANNFIVFIKTSTVNVDEMDLLKVPCFCHYKVTQLLFRCSLIPFL